MRFQPDRAEGVNLITRHEAGGVWIGTTRLEGSLLVPWQGEVVAWLPPGATQPDEDAFHRLLELRPELVIYGSGARLRFPSPAWMRALHGARIGVETMDTGAACRTYNVLAAEGRAVVAALLPAIGA